MMSWLTTVLLSAAIMTARIQVKPPIFSDAQPTELLEIRITRALQWENGCLQISLELVNRSTASLFLPMQGLNIASSAKLSRSVAGQSDEEKWLTVNSGSEIVVLEAKRLAPGESAHDSYCVAESIAVISLQRKTRREIRVQGKLRIHQSYFLTEQDWLTHKAQREQMFRNPPSKWPKLLKPQVSTIEMPIPCLKAGCNAQCIEPPLVLEGENPVIPDVVRDNQEWNERGKAIAEELARKSSPCPN